MEHWPECTIAQWVHNEGSIWWPITPRVDTTTELHLTPAVLNKGHEAMYESQNPKQTPFSMFIHIYFQTTNVHYSMIWLSFQFYIQLTDAIQYIILYIITSHIRPGQRNRQSWYLCPWQACTTTGCSERAR